METWRTYATICRLCLQKDGFMLGIFNQIQGKDKSIYKKIIDCTALQISHGDGLPNVICHRCLFKIEFCLEFRQLCFMSDATLRQINGVVSKENGLNSTNNSHLPIYEHLGRSSDGDENVVMVVDPLSYDYESDCESEKEGQSENETNETNENGGESNDVESEGRGVTMCKFCDHAFTDNAECLNHEMNLHNSETPYTCTACYMCFADRHLFSSHLKNVHKNDKPYNCPQCDRTFARRSDLRKHTIVHTGVKPYTCTVCYKSFSRNTNLSKHMRIHSGTKPFVCPKCPKTFTSKADLSRHTIIHSGQKPFRCSYCNFSFGRRDKLLRHEKKHFPTENSEDKSQELQMLRENLSIYSTTPSELQDQEEKQAGSENMIINLDPFSHNNYSAAATPQRGDNSEYEPQTNHTTPLSDHIKLEDLMDDQQLVPRLSDQSITENGTLEHKEKNESKRKYVAKQKKSLVAMKPFKCLQCPKRFSRAENLQVHQSSHSGARPFSCHICSKAFTRKRELDRHIATHSGMKPFKCSRCSKSFGRKDKMMRHMRIHDINKNFSCGQCGATFNRKDSLQQHVKVHPIQETNGED